MRVACCVLFVRVCLFCCFPFCLSCIVLVLCFILATCARFFFWCSFVLFCCQWGSEHFSNCFNRIVLFLAMLFYFRTWFRLFLFLCWCYFRQKNPRYYAWAFVTLLFNCFNRIVLFFANLFYCALGFCLLCYLLWCYLRQKKTHVFMRGLLLLFFNRLNSALF